MPASFIFYLQHRTTRHFDNVDKSRFGKTPGCRAFARSVRTNVGTVKGSSAMSGRNVISTLSLVVFAVLMHSTRSTAQLTTTTANTPNTANTTTNTVPITPTVTTTTSPVIEWDISTISNSGVDAQPGAVPALEQAQGPHELG